MQTTNDIKQERKELDFIFSVYAEKIASDSIKELVNCETQIIKRISGYDLSEDKKQELKEGLDLFVSESIDCIRAEIKEQAEAFLHDDFGDAFHELYNELEDREMRDTIEADSLRKDYLNAIGA